MTNNIGNAIFISQTTKKSQTSDRRDFYSMSEKIMNVNAIPFNHIKVTGVTALVLIAGLASCEYKAANSSIPFNYSYESKQVVASEYELLGIKQTGKKTGVAVIRIDGFKLNVSFDFDGVADSYGVAGSDFTAAEITNLAIESVTDLSGKPWNDFTNHDDHKNINILLAGYIDRNKWLEAA